ncbi:Transcription factor AP-4 Activating enhancer-binding protein 4 [Channa argus]|uniref:Transcription factor AP-4 Activating enhancer-binding protein 4 n=1 Tax=Channa argus TaxID=215402 RepID=A0A6G1QCM1_CHAAH|nr:Transcription factor AP-4 Activating enhancer-binding protein 4 [Channa argus]
MEYFMVPAQKVPSLQHFRKTEKEVIGGLCSENVQLLSKSSPIRRGDTFTGVRQRLIGAAETPPLRLFIPHLCHAACRIVVMAEDMKSLPGARRLCRALCLWRELIGAVKNHIYSGVSRKGAFGVYGDAGKLKVVLLIRGLANIPLTPETARDQERRIRREIANSNERRRMQSINAGFQSLKTLIPHSDGEKLSKAAILQQTAEYIFSLEQEKTRLLQQNSQLKRIIQELSGSSPKRRRAEEKDEGIGSPDILEEEKTEDLRREMIELRQQLEKERSVRMMLEDQMRSLDAQLYPEKLKAIAQQVHEQQAQTQSLVRLQQHKQLERDLSPAHSPQAIQHIEGTQGKGCVGEEEQRRAVIVTSGRVVSDAAGSDTASNSDGPDDCSLP